MFCWLVILLGMSLIFCSNISFWTLSATFPFFSQIAAISEQALESTGEASSEANSSNTMGWKSFDMRAVVGATEDLLHFILSEKGWRVRVFLVRDMIKVADVILQDEVVGYNLDEKRETREKSKFEVCLNSLYCIWRPSN